ncbi:extracellular catalytic domain type 1 short-chain-length polyhydroxyalkanoate depolymerase [Actinomycetospora chiangmaiensis]|uniref:extracellular catalytic domain type 1 short-chain-length polyhydroxyalkanoate depolymerase n=1 Tax=Actinomycetospora chiangmaiensis TaxID=402650 RepID=UPI00035CFED2|nr:PHB depolymerase family esterase [Actinomycetospora chiangmaiensis]
MTAPRGRRFVEALVDRCSRATTGGPHQSAVAEATRLTRAGRLTEAVAVLQGATATTQAGPMPGAARFGSPFSTMRPTPTWAGASRPTAPDPSSGTVSRGSVSAPGGTRSYRLVVPPHLAEKPALLVMLHGGTQDADTFAAATGMDDLAEREGFVVVYPEQSRSANPMGYWNWFEPAHQGRSGEAALIAAIAGRVSEAHGVDRERVFVAGFSAGAAMAAVMGAAYPDLVAGVGIHSGLPAGSARDVGSAFAAMRGAPYRVAATSVPTVVVHGSDDPTVAAVNGTRAVEAALADHPGCARTEERGGGGSARSWTRERWTDRDGTMRAEHWTVHGSGHAWSGGRAGGSYTDPAGPDASEAMGVAFGLVSTQWADSPT